MTDPDRVVAMKFFSRRQAYRLGFRDGLRGAVSVGRYDPSPAIIRKRVGSLATDSIARSRDVETVRGDVRQAERVALPG